MPFIDYEASRFASRPVEGYVITAGPDTVRLVNQQIDMNLDGNVYTACPGLDRRTLKRKEVGVSGSSLEVRVARSVLASFVPGYPPNPFEVEITRYQPGGSQWLFTGVVKDTRVEETELLLLLAGKTEDKMARRIPGHAMLTHCGRTLYDHWCRVDRADHTFPVIASAVSGLSLHVSSVDGRPDGYFAGGELVYGGEKRTITTQIGQDLTIDFPFRANINMQLVTMHPGCDKSLATCKAKFLNEYNFQGAAYQPDQNIHEVGINGMHVLIS